MANVLEPRVLQELHRDIYSVYTTHGEYLSLDFLPLIVPIAPRIAYNSTYEDGVFRSHGPEPADVRIAPNTHDLKGLDGAGDGTRTRDVQLGKLNIN